MHHAQYPEVPDDFGHWLAGFIDGEGCFTIIPQRGQLHGLRYSPRFIISLRDDDRDILEEICRRTGIGRIHHKAAQTARAGAQISWHVTNRSDIRAFTTLVDRFPLRAKKARDYAIWREGVMYWLSLPLSGTTRRGRGIGKGHGPSDWEPMARLGESLKASRVYRAAEPSPEGRRHALPDIGPLFPI